jgi:hypothetical protein
MISDQDLQTVLDDYEACERGEFSLHTLAFTVATKMVHGNDINVWNKLPEKLQASVMNIARVYRRDGTVVSQSSTGRATHDDLGARLCELLGPLLGMSEGTSVPGLTNKH